MTRIYTRTGDGGETGLIGGRRVSKADPRIEANGTLDELNSVVGAARAFIEDTEIDGVLEGLQRELFAIGAEVASPDRPQEGVAPCSAEQVTALERVIDRFEAELPSLRAFIFPGGSRGGSLLHLARSVSRRAERRVVALADRASLNPEVLRYLNRLSDLLFVLARTVNHRAGAPETAWRTADTP